MKQGEIIKEGKKGIVRKFQDKEGVFYNVYFFTRTYSEILSCTYKSKQSALKQLALLEA